MAGIGDWLREAARLLDDDLVNELPALVATSVIVSKFPKVGIFGPKMRQKRRDWTMNPPSFLGAAVASSVSEL
jgi:hypothetical protein